MLLRRLAAVPTALLGVFLAHDVAYRLVTPDAHERAHLHAETGHTWLGYLPLAGLVAVVASFALAVDRATKRSRTPNFGALLGIQFGAYTAVEIIERALSNHELFPGWALLFAGLVTQLPAAAVVWALLRFVVEPAARRVAELIARPRTDHVVSSHCNIPYVPAGHLIWITSTAAGRAPPAVR